MGFDTIEINLVLIISSMCAPSGYETWQSQNDLNEKFEIFKKFFKIKFLCRFLIFFLLFYDFSVLDIVDSPPPPHESMNPNDQGFNQS